MKKTLVERAERLLMEDEKTGYAFLEYIKDPDAILEGGEGYSSSPLTCGDEGSEISVRNKGGKLEWEFIIHIDSKDHANQYMKKDETLTEKIEKDFEDCNGSWHDWCENWVEENGFEFDDYLGKGGNTYNEDSSSYWGDVFEYTPFKDGGTDKVIIMWHNGGDVRGNYSYPEVWEGSVEEFIQNQFMGDADNEIAYRMGYEGEYDQLIEDLNEWYSKAPEKVKELEQLISDTLKITDREVDEAEFFHELQDKDSTLDYDTFKLAWDSLVNDKYLIKASDGKYKWEI